MDLYLRNPRETDRSLLLEKYKESKDIHLPWTYPPKEMSAFIQDPYRYLLCSSSEEIIGTFSLSGVIRGSFHSAYLGYEVFFPFNGKGLMKKGLNLFIQKAFEEMNFHRLEANIQPANVLSISLVKSVGFKKEGFSPQYLNIGDKGWKDHERWAILNSKWAPKNS